MDYQLVVIRGRSTTQTVKLANGVTIVGRQDGCQLRISSTQVSRRHCQLFEQKGQLIVKDLGSANGTFVNGRKIDEPRPLKPGDELGVGQIKFRVELISASASKPGDTAVAEGQLLEDEPLTSVDPIEGDATETREDDFEVLADDMESSEMPTTPPRSAAKTPDPKADPPQEETDPADGASKKKGMGEDAVAEFLLNLDVDDD